ncbi:MAG: NADH-quinone oxidoreductase subunit N, partial [Pseudomonadota bacterium]
MDFALIIDASAPELLLAAMGLAGVLAGALLGDRFAAVSYRLAAIGLFAAAGLAGVNYGGGEAFNGLVLTTPFASFAKIISFGAAGAALLMAEGFMRRQGTLRYEFALLSLFAALGMGVILSASDLMTLYMGIET